MMHRRKDVFIYAVLLLALAAPLSALHALNEYRDESRSAVLDIQIINLVNGLDLDKRQLEVLIRLAGEAKLLRSRLRQALSEKKTQMEGVFEDIKSQVIEGRVVLEKGSQQEFRQMKEYAHTLIKENDSQINHIAAETERLLKQFQLVAIDNYQPCIVPQMQEGRIGQSESPEGIVKLLARVRGIPADKYNSSKDKLAASLIDKVKVKLSPDAAGDEATIKPYIIGLFDEARGMDDVEFQINKEALAKRLADKLKHDTIRMTRSDKIKKFLLADNSVDIYREKIAKINR